MILGGNYRIADLRGTEMAHALRCRALTHTGTLCRNNHTPYMIIPHLHVEPGETPVPVSWPICGVHYRVLKAHPRRLRIDE